MVIHPNMEILRQGIVDLKDANTGNFETVAGQVVDVDLKIDALDQKVDQVCGTRITRRLFDTSSSIESIKYAGCDGVDQDLDGIADNCEEDQCMCLGLHVLFFSEVD